MAYGSLALRTADRHVHRGPRLRQRRLAGAPGQHGRDQDVRRAVRPEKFKDNVRAVKELKEIAARYGKSLAAARAALGDLAPGREHRARRLPHRRRGRGQRRRGRLDDQRRRPRRDRRDLRPSRHRHDARLLDRRGVSAHERLGRPRGQGRDRHRRRERARARAWSSASSRKARSVVIADVDARGRRGLRGRARRRRPRSSRPTSPTPTRSRPSSTSRSSGSAGSTSCATTPGIGGSFKRFLDDDFADFDRVMAVNIFGVMVGTPARGAAHGRARRRRRSSTPRRSAGSTPARA